MTQFVNIPASEWRALVNRLGNIESMLKVATSSTIKSTWVNKEEAKRLLNLKSDKALYNLRRSGTIAYNASNPRNLLYSRKDIESYLKSKSSIL